MGPCLDEGRGSYCCTLSRGLPFPSSVISANAVLFSPDEAIKQKKKNLRSFKMAAGGYECNFVDPVPESLSCAVCLLPFRDPHLVSCCGTKFCAPCISQLKAAGQPCPVCVQEFTSLLDRGYQRKVLNLKVFCSRKNDGCQWEGELRHLDHHEREECGWAEVECSYHCGAHLPRRLTIEHEREACSQRPMDVKLEWFMKSMETKLTTERERHVREMAAVREEFICKIAEMEKSLLEVKKMGEEFRGNNNRRAPHDVCPENWPGLS